MAADSRQAGLPAAADGQANRPGTDAGMLPDSVATVGRQRREWVQHSMFASVCTWPVCCLAVTEERWLLNKPDAEPRVVSLKRSLTVSLLIMVGAVALAALLLFAGACGIPGDKPGLPTAGSISGTIRYGGAGAALGRPLAIAIYRTFPPVGPPLATQLIESYEFPYRYEFSDLPPGTYYAGALIDIDRTDTRYAGMLVESRDPHGYAGDGAPVRLAPGRGVAGVDIDLGGGP